MLLPRPALALLVSLPIVAGLSSASAQRRSDFEAAVLGEAATETAPTQCSEDGSPARGRAIARVDQARMIGRAIRVPSPAGDGLTRRAGLVRIATARTDANGDLAYRLMVVLLAGSGRTWTALAYTEIPMGNAPFDYEDGIARIARLEDVDDDGEQELVVVLESQTEVECGTGYCSARATAILDVADPALPLLAWAPTQLTCQAYIDTARGTTSFRDTDGDGHRDFVVRTQACPAPDFEGEAPDSPVCLPAVTVVHRWDERTDRYLPPVPAT